MVVFPTVNTDLTSICWINLNDFFTVPITFILQDTNASWSKLVSILQYKCDWYGKKLIQVNPAYTSQICINCGKCNHRLGLDKSEWLDVREWDCPNCGTHLDRDINAAQVILKKGLATQ